MKALADTASVQYTTPCRGVFNVHARTQAVHSSVGQAFVPPFLKPSSKRKEMGNGAVVEIQGKKEGLGLAGQRADSQTSLIVSTSISWKELYTGLLVA